ncbi:MAG: hypothetical protein J6X55_16970 [Victivallales bacterium]|nr:hypothetical protein [Victivallales bacterium]
MTLLLTVFAAVVSTIVWYANDNRKKLMMGPLCWMFWGAALMWLVDAIFEYREIGAEYFTPSAADMLNDTYLGFSVIALAMVIWVVALLWKDPQGVVKAALASK